MQLSQIDQVLNEIKNELNFIQNNILQITDKKDLLKSQKKLSTLNILLHQFIKYKDLIDV